MEDRLRVAVFSRATHRHSTGGMAIAAWGIARCLADAGHDVVLYTTRTTTFTGVYPESGVATRYLAGTQPCVYEGGYYAAAAEAFKADHDANNFHAIVSISKAAKDVLGMRGRPPAMFTSHGVGLDRFQDTINLAQGHRESIREPKHHNPILDSLHATYQDRVPDIGCTEQEFYWKWDALGGVSLSACMDLQVRIGHPRVYFVPNPCYIDWDRRWARPTDIHGALKVAICAGNLLAQNKGVATVKRGLGTFQKAFPGAEVHLIGDHGAEAGLAYGAGCLTINHGKVDHARALELVGACDVLLDPSLHHSGQNGTVSEAMSMGMPVIAYPFGGATSVVVSGVTGMLVRPGDDAGLMAALAHVKANCFVMGCQARDFAARTFKPKAAGERYTEALESMIAKRSGACALTRWE